MELADVSLDDKYTKADGRIFLTGIQALVRLPMLQRQRDLAAGHDTAGYVTGYRGSPLGGFDQQLAAARRFLDQHHIKVQTAVNEDLAATALWGTQQAQLFGEGRYDGVFGMWYGKGPGVDRTGDAFRHGNLAGTAPLGGVLALMGDDHTCESSTTAHQSEYAMVDAMMPIANPAGVAEILQFGLLGFALSRYAGCWVGLKCVHDTVNTAASIDLDGGPARDPPAGRSRAAAGRPQHPLAGHAARPGGAPASLQAGGGARVRPRQPVRPAGARQPARAARHRDHGQVLPGCPPGARRSRHRSRAGGAARAAPAEARPGLAARRERGAGLRARARADRGGRGEARPDRDPAQGAALRPRSAPASSARRTRRARACSRPMARCRATGSRACSPSASCASIRTTAWRRIWPPCAGATRPRRGSRARSCARPISAPAARTTPRPGCPRAASPRPASAATTWRSGWTAARRASPRWAPRAPTGSARRRSPSATTSSRTSATAPTTTRGCWRSAPRSPPASRSTYKILFNDAVAMTGGQQVDGPLSVPQITRQVLAEGVAQVVVVTDEPEKYPVRAGFGEGVTIRHRDDLDDGAAHAARDRRHHGADLRSDLRGGEAAPAQARPDGRPGAARADQRGGVRGLRRLRPRLELRRDRAGRDRVRPQAPDRPVVLQQGLLLPERLLPELRDRGRGEAQEGQARPSRTTIRRRCRSPLCPISPGATAS